jgi:hypothetical protein
VSSRASISHCASMLSAMRSEPGGHAHAAGSSLPDGNLHCCLSIPSRSRIVERRGGHLEIENDPEGSLSRKPLALPSA